jgi:protein gp37
MQVAPACRFCYAKAWDKRYGGSSWGSKGERRMFGDKHWNRPLKWNRDAERAGEQVRVFCASMADVFEDHPALVEPRARLWDLIEATPALTWMLLTKRPENVAGMVPWGASWPRAVWLGTSAGTQKFADQRLPVLLQHPAAVRFVSAAPLLGPLNVTDYLRVACETCRGEGVVTVDGDLDYCYDCDQGYLPGLQWVIAEGESGAKARPSHPTWFRDLRDQCEEAEVAFHFKQWGEWAPHYTAAMVGHESRQGWYHAPHRHIVMDDATGAIKQVGEINGTEPPYTHLYRVGVKAAGRLLDGVLHDAFPRQPEAVSA